jgi:hypothetical protein
MLVVDLKNGSPDMTEAEIFELVFIAGTTALTSYSLFITFCFAYLTAAHFLGSRLSPLEVSIVSAIFSLSALMTISVTMANVSAMGSLQQKLVLSEIYQCIIFFMDARIYIIVVPIVSIGAVILCCYFMWSVRHPKTERPLLADVSGVFGTETVSRFSLL